MPTTPDPHHLTYDSTAAWLLRFAATAESVEPELTALDQRAGDGDFGTNLTGGMAGVRRALEALSDTPAADRGSPAVPLATAARVFLDDVGGTSGPLFGLLLQELAAAVAANPATAGTRELAAGTTAGAAAIQRVGEAEVGDKTLVDALVPAARALTACAQDTEPGQALHRAAVAAHQGARSTTDLRARRGRASYTGDHARGVPDPGAMAIALLFASYDDALSALNHLP
ncbi:dihydroxyacetone kinase subunit DhaL [Streptomyces hygroscopicus]|uniref:dihydroxyacetone kinase subunit DhaL n=1 Tax=Streptomyces hygroscopicus TaxID=1912 RepID=UPI000786118D|nr:dihydroxyacetone kinase subunit DhaL [Streptomyces hygroscopicus]MBW8092290.1 dihydroxyacetone kinase subunit L [Streptomyces hygroscopicus subsp. hygroscopicus]